MLFQSSSSTIYEGIYKPFKTIVDTTEMGGEVRATSTHTEDTFYQSFLAIEKKIKKRHQNNSFAPKVFLFDTKNDNADLFAHLTWLVDDDTSI